MGMWLLIASLSMLFGAALVGYLVIRMRASEWPPPGSSGLPAGIWISTVLLIILSILLVAAERGLRAGKVIEPARLLVASVLMALAFLGSQTASWLRLVADSATPQESLLLWGFFTLSFLHAAHVLFGLVPLVITAVRALMGRYTADRHEGVHLVAMYWHFLLVTWFGILIALHI
jgi:heme/copper-type cytochrome/quinol oxidase subunit 3